jgi:hypothetical protein
LTLWNAEQVSSSGTDFCLTQIDGKINLKINGMKQRQQIVNHMARWGFSPKMCSRWSAQELLNLATMTVRHRQYLGVLEMDELIRLDAIQKLAEEIRKVN